MGINNEIEGICRMCGWNTKYWKFTQKAAGENNVGDGDVVIKELRLNLEWENEREIYIYDGDVD